MAQLVISGATAVLEDSLFPDATVVCDNGMIASVDKGALAFSSGSRLEASGKYLVPGFVDLHVHGGAGAGLYGWNSGGRKIRLHGSPAARHNDHFSDYHDWKGSAYPPDAECLFACSSRGYAI